MEDWSQFLGSLGARVVDGQVASFGEAPADYPALLETGVLCALNDLGVLEVTGPQSRNFLQGQTTADFTAAAPGALRGACCTPQGRVFTLFTAVATAQGYLLVMPRALVESSRATLARYAALSRVNLEDASTAYRILGAAGPECGAILTATGLVAGDESGSGQYCSALRARSAQNAVGGAGVFQVDPGQGGVAGEGCTTGFHQGSGHDQQVALGGGHGGEQREYPALRRTAGAAQRAGGCRREIRGGLALEEVAALGPGHFQHAEIVQCTEDAGLQQCRVIGRGFAKRRHLPIDYPGAERTEKLRPIFHVWASGWAASVTKRQGGDPLPL